jgi:hypothetical protein
MKTIIGVLSLSMWGFVYAREDRDLHLTLTPPASSSIHSAGYSSLLCDSNDDGSPSSVVVRDYKDMVLSIIAGEGSKIIPSVEEVKESNVIDSIGEGQMAEFYRILGDYFTEEGNFSEAGKAYHEALNLPKEPEYHLRKFLSVYGISKRSSSKQIEEVLQNRSYGKNTTL